MGSKSHFGPVPLRQRDNPGLKEILCPYWRRTGYGMVRCEFLGIEGLDEARGSWEMALAHFGSEALLAAANQSPHYLPDEIKVCGLNKEEENDD